MRKLTVLDKPDKSRAIDKSRMGELCEKTPVFCRDAVERTEKVEVPDTYGQPRNVIVAGMGGSAIGGDLLKHWLNDRVAIPIAVCRDYVLPAYVNEKSLVIAVSYSGETEETLGAFLEAVKRCCMVFAISSGGHLQTFSQKLGITHVNIPKGFPPRAAIAYTFFPLVVLMRKLGVVDEVNEEIEEVLSVLQKVSEENAFHVPQERNWAKRIALKIRGTIPIIYGFRQYSAVARRLKCQFNENSKVPSKFDVFSELSHNEVVGWEAPESLTKTFSAIFIRDPEEPLRIKQRIEVTKRIISKKACEVVDITAAGRQKLAKMLSAMYIGDFASIYLALLRGVDPTPTRTIARLKEEMKSKLSLTRKFEEEIEKIASEHLLLR